MSELTVAARYAKSIIDLSQEQNALEEVNNDMAFFLRTLKANTQLIAVLSNPIISHLKKLAILTDLFEGKMNKISIAFFKLMINKGRGEVLYTTAHEFVNQYDTLKHITQATVVSATPLSEANKAKILAEVKAAAGGEVVLEAKVDPTLIGGFVLTVGDRQVDTSIANNLKKLKKNFAQGTV
ncbi:ATP synthase F1 subunit delta [Mucilaginibacter sp. UR6-11]|uniref:ATP synthase F1 subunit delta n=1 Tax=Mucilaginibacter sp. UR6-11 TaxID=1435644 RepID=UPI001E5B2C13|nr:ATP synthase F1 subunit delta [Mucilaginibacter sp. UR6-11]MCC8425123.1 ATP synthase F1 subunit delta [Mucilaginibacter sp. UR6-11]